MIILILLLILPNVFGYESFSPNSGLNWNEADTECISRYGTSLSTILSSAKNDEIWSLCNDHCWIGFNDIENEDVFVWSSNTLSNYSNWDNNQPDDNGDCVKMHNKDGKWHDHKCDETNDAVVICDSNDTNRTNIPTISPIHPTFQPTSQPTIILNSTNSVLFFNSTVGECNISCYECLNKVNLTGSVVNSYATYTLQFDTNANSSAATNCTNNCPSGYAVGEFIEDDDEIQLDKNGYSFTIQADQSNNYILIQISSWSGMSVDNCSIIYIVNVNSFLGIYANTKLTVSYTLCDLEVLTTEELVIEEENVLNTWNEIFFNLSLNVESISVDINQGEYCTEATAVADDTTGDTSKDRLTTVVIVFVDASDATAAGSFACSAEEVGDAEDCTAVISSDESDDTSTPIITTMDVLSNEEKSFMIKLAVIIIICVSAIFICIFVICFYYQTYKKKQVTKRLVKKSFELEKKNISRVTSVAVLPCMNPLFQLEIKTHSQYATRETAKTVLSTYSKSTAVISDSITQIDGEGHFRLSSDDMIENVINRNKAQEIQYSELKLEKDVIGSGQFGQVFMAIWGAEKVAVKILNASTDDENAHWKEIYGEIVLASSIPCHPNLVQIFGFVRDPLCMVMRYLQGGSVAEFVYNDGSGECRIPALREKLIILEKAASGIKFLHEYDLYHRDIAARNILLGAVKNGRIFPTTEVRVADFGLTRSLEIGENTSNSGKTVSNFGPLKWMAPESIADKEFSWKSDVYMYGITMHEVFYGCEPYPNMTTINAAMAVLHQNLRPTPPKIIECEKFYDILPAYETLMHQCWNQNRNERPSFETIICKLDEMLNEPAFGNRE